MVKKIIHNISLFIMKPTIITWNISYLKVIILEILLIKDENVSDFDQVKKLYFRTEVLICINFIKCLNCMHFKFLDVSLSKCWYLVVWPCICIINFYICVVLCGRVYTGLVHGIYADRYTQPRYPMPICASRELLTEALTVTTKAYFDSTEMIFNLWH